MAVASTRGHPLGVATRRAPAVSFLARGPGGSMRLWSRPRAFAPFASVRGRSMMPAAADLGAEQQQRCDSETHGSPSAAAVRTPPLAPLLPLPGVERYSLRVPREGLGPQVALRLRPGCRRHLVGPDVGLRGRSSGLLVESTNSGSNGMCRLGPRNLSDDQSERQPCQWGYSQDGTAYRTEARRFSADPMPDEVDGTNSLREASSWPGTGAVASSRESSTWSGEGTASFVGLR